MNKYKYTGTEEKFLPKVNLHVIPGENKGDIYEVDGNIDHPEFELVKEAQTDDDQSKSNKKKQSTEDSE